MFIAYIGVLFIYVFISKIQQGKNTNVQKQEKIRWCMSLVHGVHVLLELGQNQSQINNFTMNFFCHKNGVKMNFNWLSFCTLLN